MAEKVFEIKGVFRLRHEWQPFTKNITMPTESRARETAYCLLGAEQKTPRRQIKIESITEIKGK